MSVKLRLQELEELKMGLYDFTYVIPNNFKKRVIQYLQQQNMELADAFAGCKYEYEDVGLAFYAGIKRVSAKYCYVNHK